MLNKKACREFAAPGVAMSMDSGILQAEQVKYIIQTAVRIIDHKKTLVLYIHDREHAAQGDFLPVWTMFHSKDGYITLTRQEDGKTSWRTASFDNLGKDRHFVRECAFYSTKDQERLERYFLNSKSHGFDPLVQAQADMKARRLEKRLEMRRQKIQNSMACVPPLPHGWQSWAYQATLPAYFFYDYKKGQKSAKGICTNCGREVTLSGLKYNTKGICPHCKWELTMKSRGRRGWIENRDTCQIIQKTSPDEIVIRIIKINCYYIGDIPCKEAY